jgi:hypothetical protein
MPGRALPASERACTLHRRLKLCITAHNAFSAVPTRRKHKRKAAQPHRSALDTGAEEPTTSESEGSRPKERRCSASPPAVEQQARRSRPQRAVAANQAFLPPALPDYVAPAPEQLAAVFGGTTSPPFLASMPAAGAQKTCVQCGTSEWREGVVAACIALTGMWVLPSSPHFGITNHIPACPVCSQHTYVALRERPHLLQRRRPPPEAPPGPPLMPAAASRPGVDMLPGPAWQQRIPQRPAAATATDAHQTLQAQQTHHTRAVVAAPPSRSARPPAS